ncbi:MAG: hypothetical protein M3014_03415 [Chloroflexota bacterium]|nr:hypothetical protein [Chloroflexota bacterium]
MAYRDTRQALIFVTSGQGGYFTAKQALSVGYAYPEQHYHVTIGNWERVQRGIFRLNGYPEPPRPDLVILTLASSNRRGDTQAIISHETALDLHEISDANPAHVHLTVPPGFRKRIGEHVVLHTGSVSNAEWEDYGGYRVTTPLRTILDIASSPVSWTYLNSAVDDALRRGLLRQKELQALVHSSTNPGRERIQEALSLYASKAGELAGSR